MMNAFFDNPKTWKLVQERVIALTPEDGLLLLSHLFYIQRKGVHLQTMELMDLQRYKRVTKYKKLLPYLQRGNEEAFCFLYGRN